MGDSTTKHKRQSKRRQQTGRIALCGAGLEKVEVGKEALRRHGRRTDRLGLSHSTVKHHLANARSTVGARTTAPLVWILGPRLPEAEGEVQTNE